MKNLVLRLARQQSILFIIEDLHWSDDTSLDFLHALARISSSTPLLLLITFRSDEAHASLKSWLAQLDRERLAQKFGWPLFRVMRSMRCCPPFLSSGTLL